MNKSLLTGLVAGAAVATAGGVFAGYKMMSEAEFAQVVAVQPIMEKVKTPRQVCEDVYEKQVGYDVRYRLGDVESSVQMDHHPGERIAVQDGQLVLTQAEPTKT